MAKFRVSSGTYQEEVEAESPDEATVRAFTQKLPPALAFATSVRNLDTKKTFYIYSVYAYERVGVKAYEARKNLVLPVRSSALSGDSAVTTDSPAS